MSLESFEPATLFISVVVSIIGFVMFKYGRKEARIPQTIGGLLLMIYPYFVSSVTGMVVAGLLIGAGVWVAVRADW